MIPQIGIISLGCPKALVDSEKIITALVTAGYKITSSEKNSDLIIINTCGFINAAIEESLDTIGSIIQKNIPVFITGCLGTRKEMILERFPSVQYISGPNSAEELVEAVKCILPIDQVQIFYPLPLQGIKLTPSHYAYLKIAEGCSHSCSFCVIPKLRGPLLSRPLRDIENEASKLVQSGVKELLIIAQDTAAYGRDKRDSRGILKLLDRLANLPVWIRLHYIYPYPFIDAIIKFMAECRIVPYLDVPLQHVNSRILKLMKRPGSVTGILDRVNHWRAICPDLAIRTTMLVGFPGETDDEFQELLDFLKEAKLDRVGCFAYSDVEGASANKLPNHVPENIKQERVHKLMSLQTHISAQKLAQKRGKTIEILVDEVSDKQTIGRSYADAPEIDGQVILREKTKLRRGDFAKVRITGSSDHDLYATFLF